MKKLKLLLLQTMLCLLAAHVVNGQTSITITVTPPDTLGACMPNVFTVAVNSPGARFTVAEDLVINGNTVSCQDTGVYVIPVTTTGYINPVFDSLTKSWSVTLGSGTVTIQYHVYISCGILPTSATVNSI
jgi:hypothetical protein